MISTKPECFFTDLGFLTCARPPFFISSKGLDTKFSTLRLSVCVVGWGEGGGGGRILPEPGLNPQSRMQCFNQPARSPPHHYFMGKIFYSSKLTSIALAHSAENEHHQRNAAVWAAGGLAHYRQETAAYSKLFLSPVLLGVHLSTCSRTYNNIYRTHRSIEGNYSVSLHTNYMEYGQYPSLNDHHFIKQSTKPEVYTIQSRFSLSEHDWLYEQFTGKQNQTDTRFDPKLVIKLF